MKNKTATAETAVTKKELAALKAKRKAAKDSSKKADGSKGKLGSLLGHSVISVMRAMGKHGWDFEQAKAAIDKAKIPAAEHTIRRALKRGKNGEMRIAPVSAKELATLKA